MACNNKAGKALCIVIIATSTIRSQFWSKESWEHFSHAFSVLQTAVSFSVLDKWYVGMTTCIFLSRIKSDVSCYKLWNGNTLPLKQMSHWQYCPLAWRCSWLLQRLHHTVISHRSHSFKMTLPSIGYFATCNLKLVLTWTAVLEIAWWIRSLGHYATSSGWKCPLFLILKGVVTVCFLWEISGHFKWVLLVCSSYQTVMTINCECSAISVSPLWF